MRLILKQHFPWREGNDFRLLIDGEEIFSEMLSSIRTAHANILLEMYLLESGVLMERFIVALIDATSRGVSVYLLFDDFGARGLTETDRRRLTDAGATLITYNPLRYGKLRRNLLRDHRKLMVVDNTVAFIGGMGLTDAFDASINPEQCWHDTAVRVRGPLVADWSAVFWANWRHWARHTSFHVKVAGFESRAQSEFVAGQAATQRGRVTGGHRFGAISIQRSFLKRVRNAEHRVWMMTAYFVPPRSLLRALRRAAQRGVDVRLLLPGQITDHPAVRYMGHRYYSSLLHSGVRIFEYQPRFLHAKLLLCDDWVSLGSSNVDRWNLLWNLEANQEVENSQFAESVHELFEKDFVLSDECHLTSWQMRPVHRRMLEWFWGKVARVLERVSTTLRRKTK